MTQRILQITSPRGGVSLATAPAMCVGSGRPVAAPRGSSFLASARRLLGLVGQLFISPRGDLLWRADELPDAILKDVDPQLYEARAGRSTGWFAGDTRHLPPF